MSWGNWKQRSADAEPATDAPVAPSVGPADRGAGIEGLNKGGGAGLGVRLIGAAALLAMGAGIYFAPDGKRGEAASKEPDEREVRRFDTPGGTGDVEPPAAARAAATQDDAGERFNVAAAPAADYDVPAIEPRGAGAAAAGAASTPAPKRKRSALEALMDAGTFEADARKPAASPAPADPAAPAPDAQPAPAGTQAAPAALKVASKTPQAQAALRFENPGLTSRPGAVGACTLYTAISTEQAASAVCILTRPVVAMAEPYTQLLPRFTAIVGKVGALSAGSARIPLELAQAVTPEGVQIDLAALAADSLGRGGLGGAQVDNKLRHRLGPAILLQGLGALAGLGDRSTVGGLALGALLSGTQSAVVEALRQGANVRPTAELQQAAEVTFVLPHALDFSGVYRLEPQS